MRREYWLILSLGGMMILLPLGWLTLILILFIPGFAIASLLKEKFTPAEIVAIPLTLSMVVIPLAASVTSPLPFHATQTILACVAVIAGSYNYWKNRPLSFEGSETVGMAIAALIFLIVLAVSLKTFHIAENGELYYTSTHGLDQTFHLSIAQRYITAPHILPQDPYIAGYDIAYNWFMHVMLGEICLASGLGLLDVFKIAVSIASALVFLDAYLLALAIFGPDRKASLGAALLYVLSSGMSWLYIAYQQYTGIKPDVFNDMVYQWPGVAVLKYDPTSLYYFLPQPQTFGLVVMLLCFYLFILAIKTRSKAAAVITGLAMASLVFYHIINAFPVLAAIGLMCLYMAFKERSRPMLLALFIPLALSGVAVLAEYLTLPANAGSHIALGRHPDFAITLFVALGPLIPFAIYGLYKTWHGDGAKLLAIFAFLNLAFVNIFIMQASNDTYRFLTYLSLPVSLFAGYAIAGWIASRSPAKIAAAAMVLVIMVPSTFVIFNFYKDARLDSLASSMDVKAIYWIRDNTPPNAVIYEDPDYFPRVPILSGRNILYAGATYTRQYHGVDWQAQTEGILYMGDPGQLYGALSSYGVNYVLVGGKEWSGPFRGAMSDTRYFKKVYDDNGFKVYEVVGVPVKS